MGQEDLPTRKSRGRAIQTSVRNHNLLSLVEVGNVSLSVYATGKVASTSTMPGTTREKRKREWLLVDLRGLDFCEPIDNGQDKVAQLQSKLMSIEDRESLVIQQDQIGLWHSKSSRSGSTYILSIYRVLDELGLETLVPEEPLIGLQTEKDIVRRKSDIYRSSL